METKMAKARQIDIADPQERERVDHYILQYKECLERLKKIEVVRLEVEELRQAWKQRILTFLDEHGMTAAKTEAGSVYITTRHDASLFDADAFMDYVMRNGAFELMDRRANSIACREFAEEHGNLPPGVNLTSRRTVGVRS
jgi:hypothetical protein